MTYASSFKRALANILDSMFLQCCGFMLFFFFGMIGVNSITMFLLICLTSAQLLYFSLCIAGPHKSTLFGRWLNIQTVAYDGLRLSLDRAYARTLIHFSVSALISYLGMSDLPEGQLFPVSGEHVTTNMYIGAALFIVWHVPCLFTAEKTTLHDIIVGSRVIQSKGLS